MQNTNDSFPGINKLIDSFGNYSSNQNVNNNNSTNSPENRINQLELKSEDQNNMLTIFNVPAYNFNYLLSNNIKNT